MGDLTLSDENSQKQETAMDLISRASDAGVY